MTDHPYTTADLAQRVGLKSTTAVRKRARALNLGIDLEGRAGYRYSEADLARLVESMKPKPVEKRRKRRAA